MKNSRCFSKVFLRKKLASKGFFKDVEVPNLTFSQQNSYKKFLQKDVLPNLRKEFGVEGVFRSFFPITNSAGNLSLEFLSYSFSNSLYTPEDCIFSGRTYAISLKAKLRLVIFNKDEDGNIQDIKSIKEQEVYLCDIPLITDDGSFVINGSKKVVVSQVKRAPGVFFSKEIVKTSGSSLFTAKIIPNNGPWLDFEFDSRDVLHFRIDRKRKIPISTILRAMNMSTEDIIANYYNTHKLEYIGNKWVYSFDFNAYLNKALSHDLVCAESGKIFLKKNSRFKKDLVASMDDSTKFDINEDFLDTVILAKDIVDNDTGEVLLNASSTISDSSLKILNDLGVKSVDIVNSSMSDIGDYLINAILIDKNNDKTTALGDIYKSIRLGEIAPNHDVSEALFNLTFFSGKYNLLDVGRVKINHRLGIDIDSSVLHLTHDDIKETIRLLCKIRHNDLPVDDIDNLSNRRVTVVGELIENQLKIGMSRIEKSILEKMNTSDPDVIVPQNLINTKPLTNAIKDFFATSQLCQFMDQTNPLSEFTHKRRISALGPGGLTRERAGFEVRDVHSSHYGRICPIETPEGQNIGLINSLSSYAKINKYGFIETPYRVINNAKVTDEIVYISALDEDGKNIVPSLAKIDNEGNLVEEFINGRCNGEYVLIHREDVNLMDVSTKQLVSVATTLIPFLENDDANRALMGSNMQRQAVPLLNPDVPMVGTGMESVVAYDSDSVVKSVCEGIVEYVDSSVILVRSSENEKVYSYDLKKFVRTNQDTFFNQKATVFVGDKVEKGQIITTGHSIDNENLSLGKNVRVAFMSWEGLNFEDSIIISNKLVKDDSFTSLHIEKLEVVTRDTRLGPEEITRDIPNISESLLSKLDEEGIVNVGTFIRPGDLIVGKTTPKNEAPMTPEEKLLKVVFGEKSAEVRDSSLYASNSINGVVVDVKIFTRKGVEKDERSLYIEMQETNRILKNKDLKLSLLRKMALVKIKNLLLGTKISAEVKGYKEGDIITDEIIDKMGMRSISLISSDENSFEKLSLITKSYKDEELRLKKDVELKIEKLKAGDDLPQGVLKIVKIYIASKYKLQSGDKMAGRHGNKGVVSRIVPVEDMPYSADGTPVDVILNPLGVPSRMNIGQILETHLGWASYNMGKQINNIVSTVNSSAERVKLLRDQFLKIYTDDQSEIVSSMTDDELLDHAKWCAKGGIHFDTGVFDNITENDVNNCLKLANVDSSGQINLYDGKTGRKFDRKVTVGYLYLLKLHHLVDDKIHARSIGPYSLITQQPLGGKSHFGGQRFGEMECWALQAYGAAYSLQEMLTVKSDDVVGRIKIYESIMQGNQNFDCGIPESFNVMLKEVRSLGLNIEFN